MAIASNQGSGLLWIALRYLPRVLHVLRTEGASVLLRKLKRRLRTTAFAVPGPPALLSFQEPFQPVTLPATEAPVASVVIPVHNQFHFTHHCLAALARAGAAAAFEIIVVDDCSTDGTAARLADYPGLRLIRNDENLGFVGACNRGARLARGEFIVFLNNDTQVQAGWLDALIETFRETKDAGIVGSRLLYPDGRQQEAGGILFDDGSAWNYGHLDDPNKPEYSYRRAVDYCSGAALAIAGALFRQLDGFDRAFAPAYYEDTDLAFRVRAAGFQVYYQPLSVVIHFEGITAGRDEQAETGLKRFQRIHAETFRQRWQRELATFGQRDDVATPLGASALEQARERNVRQRVLVVDNYMVTPDRESGSLRMVNLFRILQGLGYKVTFAAANLEAPQPYVADLQRRGIEVLYRPYVRTLARHLAEHGGIYDLVILSRADAAAALMAAARRHCPRARILFDTVDLHFLREQRLAQLHGGRGIRQVAATRKRQELALMRQASLTLVVSEAERDLLAVEAPDLAVHVVSNIHRIHGCARPMDERRGLLFIGAFAHPPNTDAILFFCREVMPRLRARIPDLALQVIGADPPAEVLACAGNGVEILGYVPDVDPYFAHCRLSVAPLRYGAGVKGKINQSLAHGLPVVATTMAVEGMHLVHGESVLVADDAPAFAAAVERLYTDAQLWQRLSDGGLEVMERHFSFSAAERAVRQALGLESLP
ncbi:glycosyltransferase [uncultured Thiocystis sp.]|jgi:GT2 family glycosyltransferase/glycosyltransferase involved in cell wall biosynthesis|uniref:glycosyltransferase n=1 Tax=uncultured Thiocystis sp. TaxID=1202134 RepID=UPI0025DC874F|nr:glycosyltransferase [uncultured Thiocystis sp.]